MNDNQIVKAQIRDQICKAFRFLGAQSDLLAIVESYGETLEDEEVLDRLKQWNVGHPAP